MTKNKIIEVVNRYRSFFKERNVMKGKIPGNHPHRILDSDQMGHCYWMLDEIERFIREDRIEKAFRWLGFVQGCLWMSRCFTIEELAEHNKPSE